MNIKIAVLPSFTLSPTTSCLSCASLLPLPLLSSKAQHYNRCGPADWETTGGGSTVDEERKNKRASALQLENEASVSDTSQILSQSSHKTPQTFHKQPFSVHPCKHKQTHTHTLIRAALSNTLEHKHLRLIEQENDNNKSEAYLSCLAQFCSISVLSFTNFTYFSTSSRPDCVCFSMMSYWSWRKKHERQIRKDMEHVLTLLGNN